MSELKAADLEVYNAIKGEEERELSKIVLIASENYVSQAVLEAQGSVFTNKYAEGYPNRRYYGGCEFADAVETLAIERAKQLFGAEHVNVQPHSGSSANMAVYFSVLKPGDTILGMGLPHGGHLTHGASVSFSGQLYKSFSYGVDKKTELLDYDEVERLAMEHKPKMIVCGYSAYSRVLDFARFRKIADKVGAFLMADIAHIAGLVAAGEHPSPVPVCRLRHDDDAQDPARPARRHDHVQGKVRQGRGQGHLPGHPGRPARARDRGQGGLVQGSAPAGVQGLPAPGDEERPGAWPSGSTEDGFRIVSGATENHLMLVDLTPKNITGKDAETALDAAGITCNKNSIPYDQKPPVTTSGIRLGTPIVTTRGMREPEMKIIGDLICEVLANGHVAGKARRDQGADQGVLQQVPAVRDGKSEV